MEIQWHKRQQLEQQQWRELQEKRQHTDWTDHATIKKNFNVRLVLDVFILSTLLVTPHLADFVMHVGLSHSVMRIVTQFGTPITHCWPDATTEWSATAPVPSRFLRTRQQRAREISLASHRVSGARLI